jgi:hypothetical protein
MQLGPQGLGKIAQCQNQGLLLRGLLILDGDSIFK